MGNLYSVAYLKLALIITCQLGKHYLLKRVFQVSEVMVTVFLPEMLKPLRCYHTWLLPLMPFLSHD